jgi:uncharacterized protein (TIGR00369 family)
MTIPPLPDDPAILQAREKILEQGRNWPFFQLIGMEIVDLRPGWSMLKVGWRPDLTQPAMIMHGGIIATLIDTGIAHAILLMNVDRHDGITSIVSVDLRVKYLRPVSEGMIYCESTVTRAGKQIIHAESIVRNEEGKDVARGDSIYMAVARDRLQRGG